MRSSPWSLSTLCLVGLAGCSDLLSFEVNVGPFAFDVDTARIRIPPQYQQNGALIAVACGGAACPSLTVPATPQVRCIAGVCDPDPFVFDLALPSVVDATMYAPQLSALGNQYTRISVSRLTWRAVGSGLNGSSIGQTELLWGPETATGPTSDGVHAFGRIAPLRLGPDGTSSGDVTLVAAGSDALSNYLLHTARRFRLFARPSVDLAPGALIPTGHVALSVVLELHVEGQLIQ